MHTSYIRTKTSHFHFNFISSVEFFNCSIIEAL